MESVVIKNYDIGDFDHLPEPVKESPRGASHGSRIADLMEYGSKEGSRNNDLFKILSALKRMGMAEDLLRAIAKMWNEHNVTPPLGSNELDRVIHSVLSNPALNGRDQVIRIAREPIIDMMSWEEIINDPTPEPPALIAGGILPVYSLMAITGPEKTKKTFLALWVIYHLAAGKDWLGYTINDALKVMYLIAEGGYWSMRDRLIDMHNSADFKAQIENIHLTRQVNINLMDPVHLEVLKATLEEKRPQVLVIDPLVRFHVADENAATDMAQIMGILRGIIAEYNLSIIIVHHATKDGRAMRGSGVLLGEYDSLLTLTQDNDPEHGIITKVSFSLRHAENPDPLTLAFRPGTCWFDRVNYTPSILNAIEEAVINIESARKADITDYVVTKYGYSKGAVYKRITRAVGHELKQSGEFFAINNEMDIPF